VELASEDLDRARRGDPAAQRRFVEIYQARVFAICAALGAGDAEDLAQETLLRALTRLRSFDAAGPARLGTFVLRIARHLCIDRARSMRVRMASDAVVEPATDDAADRRLAASEDAERIRRAVLALPDDQRAAIVMVTWGELDYAEIAAIEDVPIGTVRSRIARARDALRTALADREETSRAG